MEPKLMAPTPEVEVEIDQAALRRYRHHGIRGPEEKKAWADYLRARRLGARVERDEAETRRIPGRSLTAHGTERCYKNGCRRPECRAAATVARHRRRSEVRAEIQAAAGLAASG